MAPPDRSKKTGRFVKRRSARKTVVKKRASPRKAVVKKRSSPRKMVVKKRPQGLTKGVRDAAKSYGVRLTRKVGGVRKYKSIPVLRKQLMRKAGSLIKKSATDKRRKHPIYAKKARKGEKKTRQLFHNVKHRYPVLMVRV